MTAKGTQLAKIIYDSSLGAPSPFHSFDKLMTSKEVSPELVHSDSLALPSLMHTEQRSVPGVVQAKIALSLPARSLYSKKNKRSKN